MLARRYPPSLFVWLVVVWFLLWGSVDVSTAVFGVLVAAAVLVLFPLPPITSRFHVRPLRLLRLAAFLVTDIVMSAVQVAWQAMRYGKDTRSGVIAVPVLSDVDHVIALAANVLSLGPGASVIQIDREHRIFYVYVLGVRDDEQVRRVYNAVLVIQVLVVRAFGSAEEAAAVSGLADSAARDEPAEKGVDGP
ncbi:Na+/H+ antiporter subunit E [Amycolatopsis antarctica]|uniref:Na+/H+ antiporter subunit E n=1 Tax=Amycolatopsis antarctica TaxID=1854586 RepID=A0A263CY43_9PSEU|nr:Na+/H+ antiporter subunit E [Amycolatopsis antarctica]